MVITRVVQGGVLESAPLCNEWHIEIFVLSMLHVRTDTVREQADLDIT